MPSKVFIPSLPTERLKIVIIGLALFLILSGMTIFLSFRHYQETKEQSVKEDRAVSNLISLVTEQKIQKIVRTMESYSQRPLLIRAVKERNVEKANIHLAGLIKNDPDTDVLVISDREGTLWASYPERPEVMGKNVAYREWYKGVSKEWKSYVSDVVLRIVAEKDVAFHIAVPVKDEAGNVLGIMVSTQRAIAFANILQRLKLDPGTFANITDRTGNLVYSGRFAYDKQITPFPFYFVKEKSIAAKNPTVPIQDPYLEGRTRYLTYAPVAGIDWSIFVGRDNRTILMSGLTYYIQTAAIALLLFIVSTGSFFYLRKQVLAQQLGEQLEAEKRLRQIEESEKKTRDYLDKLIGYANAPIMVWDPQFIITRFNHAFEELTGLKAEEALGKKIDLLFPEGRREECLGHIRQTTGGERWEVIEIPILYKDGSVRTVLWNSATIYSADGKTAIATIAQGQDITERKRAEEALRTSEANLRAVLDATPFPVAMVDTQDNNIHFWSQSALSLFGHTASTTPEWYQLAYPDPDYQREVIERWKPFLNKAREFHLPVNTGEYRVTCRDGSVRICELYATFLTDMLIVTFNDVTERKKAEEEIKKLNVELEQRVLDRTFQLEASNKELASFAYSVSHDLRAPLRGIDGWSLALLEDYGEGLDDQARKYLHRVRTETQLMGRLIDDMLKLSRVTRAELKLMPLDLTAMAQSIADRLQEERPQRQIEFIIQPALRANGDSQMINIALSNLFDNAVKFTGTRSPARIEFGEAEVDGGKVFFVQDNGVGFDMTHAPKLFGAFQRLHKSSEFPGTGVGLATVQRIIHRHGGRIWVNAQIDQGATFYFTLKGTI